VSGVYPRQVSTRAPDPLDETARYFTCFANPYLTKSSAVQSASAIIARKVPIGNVSPSIRLPVNPVATARPAQDESVLLERLDKLASVDPRGISVIG
jgi:hypothetical protein